MKLVRQRGRVLVAVAAALLLIGVVPSTAYAQDAPESPEEIRAQFADVELFTAPEVASDETVTITSADYPSGTSARAASFKVTCSIKAHDPHPSTGAGKKYVIFKSTVKCSGTGQYPPSVTVRVKGGLFYDYARYAGDTSNISWSQVKTSTETRVIPVNGAWQKKPFYTPRNGRKGAVGKGHYQGTSTIQILTPSGQKVGSSTSNVRWYNI